MYNTLLTNEQLMWFSCLVENATVVRWREEFHDWWQNLINYYQFLHRPNISGSCLMRRRLLSSCYCFSDNMLVRRKCYTSTVVWTMTLVEYMWKDSSGFESFFVSSGNQQKQNECANNIRFDLYSIVLVSRSHLIDIQIPNHCFRGSANHAETVLQQLKINSNFSMSKSMSNMSKP